MCFLSDLQAFFAHRPRHKHALRVLGTLALSALAAHLCVAMGTPIPWMLGPLLATAMASMLGCPTASHHRLRNLSHWVIGAALGLYFTPQLGGLVAGLWWAMVLGVIGSLFLGVAFGRWLEAVHARYLSDLSPAQLRATAYFAGAIGGANEMTMLAEREAARTDLVAAAHSLRVLMVVLTVPFAIQSAGVHGMDLAMNVVRPFDWGGLLVLLPCSGLGIWLMHRMGKATPWFMGALFSTMVLGLSGFELTAIPKPVSNTAQLLMGISLGVRFRPSFWQAAPRWLGSVAIGTLVLMLLCALFAWSLAVLTGQPVATLVLGMAPGGIAEMAVTAKVLQVGVPLVTAFQACRIVAVLVLAEPLYRYWAKRS